MVVPGRRRRRDGRTLVPTTIPTTSSDRDDGHDDDDDEHEYRRRRPGRMNDTIRSRSRSSSPLRGMIRHRHHPETTAAAAAATRTSKHNNYQTPPPPSSSDHHNNNNNNSSSKSIRHTADDNFDDNSPSTITTPNITITIPRIIYTLVGCAAWNSAILGYDAGVSSLSVLMVQRTLDLSDVQISIYLGILNLCAMVGSLVGASAVNERYGRRGCFVVTSVGFILGDIIQASAQSFTTLIVGRSLLGFSIGQGLAIDPIYISEISPPNVRGFLVSWSEIAINLGWIFGFASGIFFYQVPDNLAWRYMYTCGAILPITMLLLVKWYMPESPRWLLSKGHDDEARRVLKRLYFDHGPVTTTTTTPTTPTNTNNNTNNPAVQSHEYDHGFHDHDSDDTGVVGMSHGHPQPPTHTQLTEEPYSNPSPRNPRTSLNDVPSTTTTTTTTTEGEGDHVESDDEVETMMNDIKVALRQEQANAGQELGWSFLLCRPTPAYRRMLLAGFIAGISQQVVGIEGINSFETFVLDQSGVHDRYWQAMTLVGIQIIKSFVTVGSSRLVDTWGRRALSFISIGGIVVSLLVLAVDFHLSSGATSNLAIVGLLGYMVSFAAGMGPVGTLNIRFACRIYRTIWSIEVSDGTKMEFDHF